MNGIIVELKKCGCVGCHYYHNGIKNETNVNKLVDIFNNLKRHKEIIGKIDPEFFFNFGEVLIKAYKIVTDERDSIYNDYQDLGKELHIYEENSVSNLKINALIKQIEAAIDFSKTDKSKTKVNKIDQQTEDLEREIQHLKKLMEDENEKGEII